MTPISSFSLTTNRPDLLEPALASRPGRVDQAIAIPLPDEVCRRRLFALYGRGLTLRVSDLPRVIAQTEGASAAFIREAVRKAALFAADDGPEIIVEDRHLDEALHDLVVQGGSLTKSLLGYRSRIGFRATTMRRTEGKRRGSFEPLARRIAVTYRSRGGQTWWPTSLVSTR